MNDTKQAGLAHPHDLLVKNFLTDVSLASDLFKNYLAEEWMDLVDFDSLKQESTESVDRTLAERRADLRYSATLKGTNEELGVFVFLEHQSRSDRFMAFRLLEYICAAYRQHLSTTGEGKDATFPPPLTVVLHHGKTPWKKVLSMRELFNSRHDMWMDTLKFPICLIDLARIPGDQLRGHQAVCALLDSLQSASTGRLTDRATGIFSRLRNLRGDSRLNAWVTALATYYLAVQGKVQKNYDTLSQALKTLYSAREAEDMTLTFAESWKAEGKVDSMLLVLESRFGDVPAGIQKKLSGVQDNHRIENMIKGCRTKPLVGPRAEMAGSIKALSAANTGQYLQGQQRRDCRPFQPDSRGVLSGSPKLAATCQSLKEFQKAL